MIAPGNQYIAVLDTCVLAPMPLCDTLPRLAEDPAFYIPKWPDEILRELRSTLQRIGYTLAQADRRITAMETAFEDANVAGYENLDASMTNDPKDRHVLAGRRPLRRARHRHLEPEALPSRIREAVRPRRAHARRLPGASVPSQPGPVHGEGCGPGRSPRSDPR